MSSKWPFKQYNILRYAQLGLVACALLMGTGCKQEPVDVNKPVKKLTTYFDAKYLLYKLPDTTYTHIKPEQTFEANINDEVTGIGFMPLGYDPKLKLQYTHVYSPKCVYNKTATTYRYAEVCFPNICLTQDMAYASVVITNPRREAQTFYLRLFYQNTSYWFPTNNAINKTKPDYLDNYYGASDVLSIEIPAMQQATAKIPYRIGLNAKHESDEDPSKDPARPGNYEFMLLAMPDKKSELMDSALNLKKVNPFAVVKLDELNGGKKYYDNCRYVGPQHFKFVFLDEYFDGTNDLADDHVYLPKAWGEKRLCDTCSGWYKNIISEFWKHSDYESGYVSKGYYVKADYGIKKENYHIDSTGITLTVPKSTRGDYKKTWGEFLFGPAFKYGHLTLRAKLGQMMNKTGTPNGLLHNIWLYQRDADVVDTIAHPHALKNGAGKQPFEIDYEIWSATEDPVTIWDPYAFITCSIVDYMQDSSVNMRPRQSQRNKRSGVCNNRTVPQSYAVNGAQFDRKFFDDFHVFELFWYPDKVKFVVDGYEKATITRDMAKIPDKTAFLWVGTPLYQNGTYYSQSQIPFLKNDKKTIIDYLRIE